MNKKIEDNEVIVENIGLELDEVAFYSDVDIAAGEIEIESRPNDHSQSTEPGKIFMLYFIYFYKIIYYYRFVYNYFIKLLIALGTSWAKYTPQMLRQLYLNHCAPKKPKEILKCLMPVIIEKLINIFFF